MKSYILAIGISGISFFAISCGKNKTTINADDTAHQQYDISLHDRLYENFSSIPESATNPQNPYTAAKVELGYHLYYDNRLSLNNTISCNSCHNLATYGVDGEPTSEGDDGGRGDRNSPTVLNAAFHTMQFWDGRATDIEQQAGMPILNPVEMAIPSEGFLMERLKGIELYQKLFKSAFPNDENPFTYTNLRLAIASFERELITPSRFDHYMNGDSKALSVQEKKGLSSFINLNCISCHNGSMLGGNMLQKFGVYASYMDYTNSKKEDLGLMTQTNAPTDKYMFKVPSLRNVAKTGPYFHDGSVTKLEDAVKIMGKVQLNADLSTDEISNITAFLNSLTGEIPEKYKKAPQALSTK